MTRRLTVLVALLSLAAGIARGQDVRSVLQAAARNMGALDLKTIEYSGTGWDSAVGQSYSLTTDWPRFELTSYTRVFDYEAQSSREERTRRQGNTRRKEEFRSRSSALRRS
jgi:hypothetical protein